MLNLRVQKIFEFGRGENSGAASTGQPGSGPRAAARRESSRRPAERVGRHLYPRVIDTA